MCIHSDENAERDFDLYGSKILGNIKAIYRLKQVTTVRVIIV